jgi:hypothetical protein
MMMRTLFGEQWVESRVCRICDEEKPLTEEFFACRAKNRKGEPVEYRTECKSCGSKRAKELRSLKKVHDKVIPKDYCCPICNRTEDEFDSYKQGVTTKQGLWCLDHDHKTGKYRGHICQQCNTILARARDEVDTLKRAIEYLENHT